MFPPGLNQQNQPLNIFMESTHSERRNSERRNSESRHSERRDSGGRDPDGRDGDHQPQCYELGGHQRSSLLSLNGANAGRRPTVEDIDDE